MTEKASARPLRLHRRVLAQIDQLAALADEPAELSRRAPEVSSWSVAQQLEHLALSDRGIVAGIEKIERGEIAERGGKINAVGRKVLLSGRIPSGRGQAPPRSTPQGLDGEQIAAALATVKQRFEELDLARLEASQGTFPHPYFGHFRAVQWLRFVDLHHVHHQKIIADIRRSS